MQCMKDIHIHHLRLLLVLSQLACVMLLPIWLYTDLWDILTNLHKVLQGFWGLGVLWPTTKKAFQELPICVLLC